MGIEIREVVFGSADHLTVQRLRFEVYAREEAFCLAGMDHQARTFSDAADAGSHTLAAFDGSTAVGTLRVTPLAALPPDDLERRVLETLALPLELPRLFTVGRLMVLRSYRGTQVSGRLFAAAALLATRRALEAGLLTCSPRHLHLYESLGARVAGAPISHPEYGMLLPLVVLTRDLDWMRRIRSPLLPHLVDVTPCRALAAWFEHRYGMNGTRSLHLAAALGAREGIDTLPLLLRDLPDAFMARLLRSASIIQASTGTPLLDPGSKGTELFVVLDGQVALSHPDREECARVLRQGEHFAEDACLGEAGPFPWRAIATEDTRLLAISAETLAKLAGRFPDPTAALRLRLQGGTSYPAERDTPRHASRWNQNCGRIRCQEGQGRGQGARAT